MLLTAEGKPACCLFEKEIKFLDFPSFQYLVYGFEPYFAGQQPTAEPPYDDPPLYAWAKIWKKNRMGPAAYGMAMATGADEFEKADAASFSGKAPGMGSPKCAVSFQDAGCCLIDLVTLAEGELAGCNAFQCTLAAGVDPLLMIAFVAAIDKMAEKLSKAAAERQYSNIGG